MENQVTFRLLEKKDLPLLHKWLNNSYMKPYYQPNPISLEEVIIKYSPRIEGSAAIFCHLALLEQQPFGKIQCYKNSDWTDYASEINLFDGISVDYFIGEPSHLRLGLGKQMLDKYIQNIVFKLFAAENKCYICHDEANLGAIKCSQSAGFEFARNVIANNKPSKLYQKTKG